MDPAMRAVWDRMTPVPGDLRLYGGTALALYLNHRPSTDFDFATPAPVVNLGFVGALPWLEGARLRGGDGMVDALVSGGARGVVVTFMECGSHVPLPVRDPVGTARGIAIAHPVDLAAAKIEACLSRGATRDFVDVAAALGAWPQWCREAVRSLPRNASDVARGLVSPPSSAAQDLPQDALRRIRSFGEALVRTEHGPRL